MTASVAAFKVSIDRLAREMNKDVASVVLEQSKLATREAIVITPPNSTNPFQTKESFNEQRKLGLERTRGDINKVFIGMKRFARGAINFAREHQFLFRRGSRVWLVRSDRYMPHASASDMGSIHKQYRSKATGRVNASGLKDESRGDAVIVNKSAVPLDALTKYIKQQQSKIGKAKSGWMRAVRGLGVRGIPSWIARQHGQGGLIKKLRGPSPSISIINSVPYLGPHANRILSFVYRRRADNTRKRIERIVQARIDKENKRKGKN